MCPNDEGRPFAWFYERREAREAREARDPAWWSILRHAYQRRPR